MKSYDKEQLNAINANGGYHLVLAPPGCGKTDILSERIVRARQQGVDFGDMLCLTFTNRASRGMYERVRQKIGEEASGIFVGNVHRFCSNFLYSNALVPENSSIIDDDDLTDILLDLDQGFFLNRRGNPDKAKVSLVENIDAYISQRQMKHPAAAICFPKEYEHYYQIAVEAAFDPGRVDALDKLVKYALLYRQYKTERSLISFSDILILAYEALRNDTAREYKRYRWIQVDEVQDLNALQTAIIDLLTDTSGDFTVMYLGDEQQAIFSFLGAKLNNLNLLRQRCEGHVMTLGTNYRSPKYLLDIFNTYAAQELHVDSALLPQPSCDAPHGKHDLILTGNATTVAEEERVPQMIRHYLSFDGERLAILVPTNDAADRISDRLNSLDIPHFKISGTDMFRSKSYKAISSLLTVCVNDFNHLAWARLLHGIGAIATGTYARNFMVRLQRLMMTPSDLLSGTTYLARFCEEYMNREFVFFDTETTGLNTLEDDIVQIAAFKVRNGQRVPDSDFNIFLHTDKPIPAMLGSVVNPLTEAYAAAQHYDRAEGLRMFIDYIGDCPLLGHNVTYDYRILQSNVERTLHEHVTYDTFDSLHLIKCVEPDLRIYKLAFLLRELQLEGKNSHLADEDIAATKALVDYCYQKAQAVIPQQQKFIADAKVQAVIGKMEPLRQIFSRLRSTMFLSVNVTGRTIADELADIHREMVAMELTEDLGDKFATFIRYAQSEWTGDGSDTAVYDQICAHVNDMTAGTGEGDLVNTDGLIEERVFIMTIYKGKGLEFDNVVVLQANDGTYPFFTVNKVLQSPHTHTREEIAQAETDRLEDARKFYVALSRAKKRLCVSYSLCNSYGIATQKTPFMKSIEHFFN